MKGAKKEVKNSRFLHTITTTIQVVLVTSVRTAPPIHGGGNPYQYISRCCKQFFCILRLSMCRHLSLLLSLNLQIYIFISKICLSCKIVFTNLRLLSRIDTCHTECLFPCAVSLLRAYPTVLITVHVILALLGPTQLSKSFRS